MLVAAVAVAASLVAGFVVWRIAMRSVVKARRQVEAERKRVEALALEDPLTRLPNKRAFTARFEAELSRAAREYYSVAVVALELDGSRENADEALVQLASHVLDELRGGDLCARMEGAQITLALVRADAHAAERVLTRVRAALDAAQACPGAEPPTFSAGIAEFPRHGAEGEALLRCARATLSVARAAGRNGGVVAIHSAPGGAAGKGSASPAAAAARASAEDAGRQRGLVASLEEMAQAVDGKNRFTVGHAERVATYAVALARSVGFPEDRMDALRQAALLHDVGKIGIRETILAKEQPLNLEELSELERHSELGRAMLSGAGLPELARWVNHLHERFDGEGYPFGLAGRAIPLESRILHVADALDGMTRPNALRRNRPQREALAELSYAAGGRLDPEIAGRAIDLVRSGELAVGGDPAAKSGSQPARGGRQTIGRPSGVR